MSLTCADRNKIIVAPIAQIFTTFLSVTLAPFQVRAFGMRTVFLLTTSFQALLCAGLIFVHDLDMLICVSFLLGLTGGRQAFAFEYISDMVPISHCSFVAMWFSASFAAVTLAMSSYFFYAPNSFYLLITLASLCILNAIVGACILNESPMQLLTDGNSSGAAESLRQIKKFNKLGNWAVSLYDLNEKIKFRNVHQEKLLVRYICCTKNVTNLLIIALIQVISAFSLGMLDF